MPCATAQAENQRVTTAFRAKESVTVLSLNRHEIQLKPLNLTAGNISVRPMDSFEATRKNLRLHGHKCKYQKFGTTI